jgi:acyl-homoserine lactone acylase PvdQ
MELNCRIGLGTISELFGELTLDTDRIIRPFGFNRLGQSGNIASSHYEDLINMWLQGEYHPML